MSEEKLLTNAEQILSADDFTYAYVSVPEWGGKVRVRAMTASQRDILSKAMKDKGESDAVELAVVMCVVDEDGNRIFQRQHLAALKKKSTAPLNRIMQKIGELSNAKPEDIDAAEENLDGIPTDDLLID